MATCRDGAYPVWKVPQGKRRRGRDGVSADPRPSRRSTLPNEDPMAEVLTMRATSAAVAAPRLKDLDDSSVVARFMGGDARAFAELVNRYHVRLVNFIYRTIG